MGTQILGSTAGGNSVQYYYNLSDVPLKAINNSATTPVDLWIDSIVVFGSTNNGNAATGTCALYTTGGSLICTTPLLTWSGSPHFQGQTMTPFHIGAGVAVVGAMQTNGQGVRTWGMQDGGSFSVGPTGGFPGSWSGSTQGGLGNMAWYATYFPTATCSPTTNHATHGTTITINGQSYSAGVTSVTFNGVASGTVNVLSDTQLTAVVPSGATTGVITVNTNAGSGSSGTFTIDPHISSISPSHGAPGTSITISGDGFSSATNVWFPTYGADASITINSDTQITVNSPAGATTGALNVGDAFVYSNNSSTFTVDTGIGSFSPTSGGVGTAVTITGAGFTGTSAVIFNTTNATSFTVVNDSSITTVVPNGATTGPISVTSTGGTATSATSFVVAPGWFHESGVITRLKGVWYKNGGVLNPVKGIWYKNGGTLHPLK